jgi:2-methylcitrate dehydratase
MADGPDKWRPQTHETADHSIPYAAGVVLKYGNIEPEYYEDPYLHDPVLLQLVDCVRCLPSEEAERLELSNLCELELLLKSGVRKTFRVEYHRGHFKNPMTDSEVESKFRKMAQNCLPPDRIERLLSTIWNTEDQPDLSNLISATVI